MSQAGIISEAGSLPPSVPLSFVTDNGTAVAASNVLDVFGDGTSGDPNNIGLNTFTRGVGNKLTVNALASTTINGNGTFTLTNLTYCNTYNTGVSTCTVNLPAGVPNGGKRFLIVDGAGNASVNNITINGNGNLINGIATVVINTNWGSVEVFAINALGTAWVTI